MTKATENEEVKDQYEEPQITWGEVKREWKKSVQAETDAYFAILKGLLEATRNFDPVVQRIVNIHLEEVVSVLQKFVMPEIGKDTSGEEAIDRARRNKTIYHEQE